MTKNGWKPSQDSIIGELSANSGLIVYSEEDKNAMITCQNIEGKQ